LESPDDIVPWQAAAPHFGKTYRAAGRSVVMLFDAREVGTGSGR
jgi:hypothetical protein